HEAITKNSTSSIPIVDYDKCIGCMECVYQCPGLAIFGYATKKDWLFLPIEYNANVDDEVFLVDNNANIIGEGKIERILKKKNKTNIARVKITEQKCENITDIRGFIVKDDYDVDLEIGKADAKIESKTYVCHCDDVTLDEILEVVGERKFISVDEIKHTTRLGMGACRGKRCIPRLKQTIRKHGITVVGDATPRGPMSNQLTLGELYPKNYHEKIIPNWGNKKIRKVKTDIFIAGGGIGGSALFRYFAEAGKKPVLANYGRGASWRNIAGGRPNFSLPELSDIASQNLQIFKDLQKINNIDYLPIKYVTFAHDDAMQKALEASCAWSDAELIKPSDFKNKISEHINPNLSQYQAALITNNCWQASPGKTIDLIRQIGINNGGTILEDTKLLDINKEGSSYNVLVQSNKGEFVEYTCPIFINALGPNADKFAKKTKIDLGLSSIKHQAFITRRLPFMGINNTPLPMIIDRRKYKGFSAVYGQQLAETGQIIGCASPQFEASESGKNLIINTKDFFEIISEVFCDWFPNLTSAGFQAVWSGYYVEPRMI
ncbi:MAG: FAD-dependent oxidoreductase, partial [Bacteroidota bacterium]|nr:FAD-dependent oxidoreductase [Bacteroidota bacterium]